MFLFWTFAAALSFAVGGAYMKASDGMTRAWPTVAMYITFAAGATFQALALREAELCVAYLFSLGLEALLVFAFGHLIFAESPSLSKVLGVVSIVIGLALMHLGESDSSAQARGPTGAAQVQPASVPTGEGR
jgi:multidrug transporter EmrE-like cation transporter